MTIYSWEYGSTEAGLVFTVIYDSVAGTFTVNVLEGHMELNALWFSDGNTSSDGFTLKKGDNSLNMNGTTEVWDDDGTSEGVKIVWDDYLITSATNSSKNGYDLSAGGSVTFDAPADFDPETFTTVGVRATDTSTTDGSIKWADSVAKECDSLIVYSDDVLVGSGVQQNVRLVGDAELLHGCDVGGNDTITGAANALKNLIYGDAYEMSGQATGGDDVIVGGADTESNAYTATPWLFGNFLYGDAFSMTDNTVGGNDTMTGGANSLWNYIRGDAFVMSGSAQGGNDVLNGGVGTTYARLYGDAAEMYDNSVGGDDELTGSDNADRNLLIGDAFDMLDNTVGGDDKLYGGDNVNTGFYGYDLIYGDAIDVGYPPYGVATGVKGGNDILEAGDNSKTYMWGDSQTMYNGVAYGGNDILTGGGAGANQFTYMVGDTDQVLGTSNMTGGNDRLISGSGSDYMYGDFAFVAATATAIGGIDTFVFQATNNGDDFVYDFEDNKDKLEFVGLSSGSLTITDDGTNSTIAWAGGSVSVFGVTATALSNDLVFT